MEYPASVLVRMAEDTPQVGDLITLLNATQEVFYAIGRYLQKGSTIGRLPDPVKAECTLIIKHMSMNSPMNFELSTPPLSRQMVFGKEGDLRPESRLCKKSMNIFVKTVEAFTYEEKEARSRLREIIDIPEHRVNIVRKVDRLIPQAFPIEVGSDLSEKRFVLSQEKRTIAYNIVLDEEAELVSRTEGVDEIIGPIVEARIVEKRYFKIGDKECLFREDDVPVVRELLGKVISLRGKTLKENEKILKILEILDLQQLDEWRFTEISFEKHRLALSEPLFADVSFEEDAIWVTDRLNLNVIGQGATWEETLSDFQSSFSLRFITYVGEPDSNLTPDAIDLRNKLRSLVPDWKEALALVGSSQNR